MAQRIRARRLTLEEPQVSSRILFSSGDRIGLDRQAFAAQLAGLRQWADTVLRRQYGGYELRDCWPNHVDAIWELSTLAVEWHHVYGGARPDLARALEFYDRWLPGTMRRIAAITRTCMPECDIRRRTWSQTRA